MKGQVHRLGERACPQLGTHEQEPRYAAPLVVGAQLVAGQRQAGAVPPDADPRSDADAEDDDIARNVPLNGDDVALRRRGQIVVVGHEQVAGTRGSRCYQQVGAAPLGPARLRRPLLPQFLDRRGEEQPRIDACSLGRAVELLDQPGKGLLRGEPAAIGLDQKLAHRAASPGHAGPVQVRRPAQCVRTCLADLPADHAVAAADAEQRYLIAHERYCASRLIQFVVMERVLTFWT